MLIRALAPWILILAAFQLAPSSARAAEHSTGCRWSGQPAAWLLARPVPASDLAGWLGSDILPFLYRQGFPISFISNANGDARIQLKLRATTTLQDVLDQIVSQAPGYRYQVFEDRVVLYPSGEVYDTLVTVTPQSGIKRGQALIDLLHALRDSGVVKRLGSPTLRGWGRPGIYGDSVDIGGRKSVVEHLVTLLQKRPSATFQLLLGKGGRLYFDFDRAPLIQTLDVLAPAEVDVGATFEVVVKGALSDGTVVLLQGFECYVEYGVTSEEVLTIDDVGQVSARHKGSATIVVQYEEKRTRADVHVR